MIWGFWSSVKQNTLSLELRKTIPGFVRPGQGWSGLMKLGQCLCSCCLQVQLHLLLFFKERFICVNGLASDWDFPPRFNQRIVEHWGKKHLGDKFVNLLPSRALLHWKQARSGSGFRVSACMRSPRRGCARLNIVSLPQIHTVKSWPLRWQC